MQTPEEMVAASAMRYWKQVEDLRVKKAQKLYFWYHNYQDEIIESIKLAMLKGWREKTVDETRIRVLNVVARVIDKLALVYKERPERVLDGGKQYDVKVDAAGSTAEPSSVSPPSSLPNAGGTPTGSSSTTSTKPPVAGEPTQTPAQDAAGLPPVPPKPKVQMTENQSPDDVEYQALLESSSIEERQGDWEKLSKLFNTILVQPVWREDEDEENGGHIDFLIHTPAWCCVETKDDDYAQANSFWYPIWKSTSEGKAAEQVLVYWSEKDHYIIDANGGKINGVDNSAGKNPYGVLPAAILRRRLSNDFWGEGLWDLVDGNEEICIQITNLFKVAAFQLHGQPFGVNLNLGGEPALGADKPILVDNVESGTVQPTFEFVSANPQLKPVMDLVDWALKNIELAKGMGVSQVDTVQTVASGASKMVDNADVQEGRQDAIPVFQSFEKELYEKTVAVYNYHTSGKKITDKAEFSIKFPEPKITETQDEKNKKREAGLKNKTLSRIDIIMEDFNLTRDEAKLKLRQIIAEDKEINDEFGLNTGAMDAMNGSQPQDLPPEALAKMSPEEKMAYDKAKLKAAPFTKQPQPTSAVTQNLK